MPQCCELENIRVSERSTNPSKQCFYSNQQNENHLSKFRKHDKSKTVKAINSKQRQKVASIGELMPTGFEIDQQRSVTVRLIQIDVKIILLDTFLPGSFFYDYDCRKYFRRTFTE